MSRSGMLRWRWLLFTLIVVVLFLSFFEVSLAQSSTETAPEMACEIEQVSNPAEGNPFNQATLRCDFTGGDLFNDRIMIIDRNNNLQADVTDWRALGDFTDDLWLFDYQGDEQIELIMAFDREDEALVAKIYDIQAGIEQIAYPPNEQGLSQLSQLNPTLRVVAADGWWIKNGVINFNLDIYIDGVIEAVFVARESLGRLFTNDGTVDITIFIRDKDGEGRPDIDWRTLLFPEPAPPITSLIPPTYLMVNTRDNEQPLVPTFPWPYLGNESYGYLSSSAQKLGTPPIQMNWERGEIMAISEIVSSRANDSQWFVYSFDKIEAGEPITPTFESPFTWYDLAEDEDRQSELAVRVVYYPPHHQHVLLGTFSKALTEIRYSWDQTNNGFWDYKVSLLGTHLVTDTVSLPEIDVEMTLLPYEQVPEWVVDRAWGPTLFVAAERQVLGEGIYMWDPPAWLSRIYFSGGSDEPLPNEKYEHENELATIDLGFRGEYRYNLEDKSRLYFSPVDRKLHLLNAEGGMWNIDDISFMQYANLNDDDHIDQWTYTTTILSTAEPLTGTAAGITETATGITETAGLTMTRQLNVVSTHLVYSDHEQVRIREAEVKASSFETLPPKNHDEWKALGTQIERHAADFEPGDFIGMMAQFGGAELRLTGATGRNYRPFGENGFRLTVELQPGFQVQGDNLFDTSQLAAGQYVLTYDGQWTVEPLTEASLSITLQLPEELSILKEIPIKALTENNGLTDVKSVQLIGTMSNGEQPVEIIRQEVELLSEEVTPVLLNWHPKSAGKWVLHFWIEDQEEDILIESKRTVTIPLEEEASDAAVFTLSTNAGAPFLAVVILLSFAASMMSVLFVADRRT